MCNEYKMIIAIKAWIIETINKWYEYKFWDVFIIHIMNYLIRRNDSGIFELINELVVQINNKKRF